MKAIRTFSLVLGVCAAVLWAISAVYWDFSAGVEIHDSLEALHPDLIEAAKWNKWAAGFACAASAFTVADHIVKAWTRGRSEIG